MSETKASTSDHDASDDDAQKIRSSALHGRQKVLDRGIEFVFIEVGIF